MEMDYQEILIDLLLFHSQYISKIKSRDDLLHSLNYGSDPPATCCGGQNKNGSTQYGQ